MNAAFEHPVTVRWRDTDALGHVNHVVFLTYLEEARDAFYASVAGADPIYVVVRMEIDLRAEVRHEDRQVIVTVAIERLGTTSLTTRETIRTQAGHVVAEARVVTVRWDAVTRQPVPFSAAERDRLAAQFLADYIERLNHQSVFSNEEEVAVRLQCPKRVRQNTVPGLLRGFRVQRTGVDARDRGAPLLEVDKVLPISHEDWQCMKHFPS